MISNPCKWFINGSKQKEFVYEGGCKLFHFSPNDNNLSPVMDTNLVFFANDEAHALDVLKRMLQFRIDVAKEYVGNDKNLGVHSDEFIERVNSEAARAYKYLDAVNNGKVKLTEAPMNQFFKVGWASNDTILN